MALYFLNAVNISTMFSDPAFQGVSLSIIIFQVALLALLIFSRQWTTSVLSITIPAICFIVYSGAIGSFDIAQRVIIPAIYLGLSIGIGIPRGKLVKKVRAAAQVQANGSATQQGSTDPTMQETRKLIVLDIIIAAALSVVAIIIVAFGMLGSAFFVTLVGTFFFIPGILCAFDILFFVACKRLKRFYHPTLTHHMVEDSDHTFSARFGNLTVFFCSRCGGMLMGLFISMYALIAFRVVVPPLIAFLIDCFIAVPGLIDWGSQRLGYRKSTTRSRVITGGIIGLGFILLPQASPDYSFASIFLLMAYFAVFFLLYYGSVRRGYYTMDVTPDEEEKPSI